MISELDLRSLSQVSVQDPWQDLCTRSLQEVSWQDPSRSLCNVSVAAIYKRSLGKISVMDL